MTVEVSLAMQSMTVRWLCVIRCGTTCTLLTVVVVSPTDHDMVAFHSHCRGRNIVVQKSDRYELIIRH
ncbi:hypothetical protein GW17_00030734 [Ensete ventricosum]|nr:hypothetical protein GW17_00030734 [Ensete ventricosum]